MNDITLSVAGEKARLDKECKMLLADKMLLAWILKTTVPEVVEYSCDEITGFIEGDPEISEHPVHPNEKIEGRKNESSYDGEGTVMFDVIFNLEIPSMPKPIKIIINLEGQNNFHPTPGYNLATRGIYYCARMISEQKEREFFGSDYNSICKVYSIWLCFDAKEAENTITEFSLRQSNHFGDLQIEKTAYDKMSVVLICLPKGKTDNKLLQMLDSVFSRKLSVDEKIRRLENQGFHVESSLKERVDDMCNYSAYVENCGIEKGIEKGIQQGMQKTLRALKLIAKGMSDEDIMKTADITKEELQTIKNA